VSELRIGTLGYVYPHWKGRFYPRALPRRTGSPTTRGTSTRSSWTIPVTASPSARRSSMPVGTSTTTYPTTPRGTRCGRRSSAP